MSDRDKKIILVLLIIAVVALPYVFVIKDTRVATETIKAQIVELEARLEHLREMDAQRDFYISETERLNKERDKIVALYPADVRPENYTMFLLETEYSSVEVGEDGEAEWVYPLRFDTLSYADNVETEISTEDTNTGLVAVTNASTLSYICYYDGLKYLLQYIMDYVDPMIYSSIDVDFDSELGVCSGDIVLSQYAIKGNDRTLKDVVISPNLDDYELRGNEDVGIFGPINKVLEEDEENAEESNEMSIENEEAPIME